MGSQGSKNNGEVCHLPDLRRLPAHISTPTFYFAFPSLTTPSAPSESPSLASKTIVKLPQSIIQHLGASPEPTSTQFRLFRSIFTGIRLLSPCRSDLAGWLTVFSHIATVKPVKMTSGSASAGGSPPRRALMQPALPIVSITQPTGRGTFVSIILPRYLLIKPSI